MAEPPSSLIGGSDSSAGICPSTVAPTVSIRYLPTMPLPLASPWGWRRLFEFSRMRADSQAPAASTTARPCTQASRRFVLSM
jgi:hypothetical protein